MSKENKTEGIAWPVRAIRYVDRFEIRGADDKRVMVVECFDGDALAEILNDYDAKVRECRELNQKVERARKMRVKAGGPAEISMPPIRWRGYCDAVDDVLAIFDEK